MNLTLTVNAWIDEDLMFAQQFGVSHLVVEAVNPETGGAPDARALSFLRNRVEKAGFELVGLNRFPHPLDRTRRGLPGRDAEIEAIEGFIRSASEAGISLIGYEWPFDDMTALKDDREIWTPLAYFLERVLPDAEQYGVRLMYTPSATTPGTLDNPDGLTRLMEIAPSSCHGLDFHPSVLAETPDINGQEAARRFSSEQKIFMVTADYITRPLSSASGTNVDILDVMSVCRTSGYSTPVRPGAQPVMPPDTEWGHKAQAMAIGYLRALLQGMEKIQGGIS